MVKGIIKMNNRSKRLIIASVLVCASLTTGLVTGIQISSKHEIISTLSPNDQLVKLLQDKWYSDIYYGKDCDEDVLINQFVGALSTNEQVRLDPYTYIRKNESSQSVIETGKLGITITYYYNYPVIIDVDKNGASYNKLQVGDIITKAGKNYKDEFSILDDGVNYSNILTLALGKPDENVFIKVARFVDNKLTFVDYELTLKSSNGTNYAYIEDQNIDDTLMVKLTGFTTSSTSYDTCNQLKTILTNNTCKNLILDIRDNGGGDLSSVVNICDLFLSENVLVTKLEYKDGRISKYYTKSEEKFDYDKIIILQNGNTASASEILISTLSYYLKDKVTLIGSKSYGKGIAQVKASILNNHYILQYTCAKWLRPDDSWIGMTQSAYTEGYQLGFDPSEGCCIVKSDLLNKMEENNRYVYYKTLDEAYKIDKVASQNKYFFEIYNMLYNENCRTDYYFDNNCKKAIENFQNKYDISQTGTMNEETFLYFLRLFYNEKTMYSDSIVNKAKDVIEG